MDFASGLAIGILWGTIFWGFVAFLVRTTDMQRSLMRDDNKEFSLYGRLVKHSYKPELGTGILKDRRMKERMCPETGMGGSFVGQYKVWFADKGDAWYDAGVILYLPTDTELSMQPSKPSEAPASRSGTGDV